MDVRVLFNHSIVMAEESSAGDFHEGSVPLTIEGLLVGEDDSHYYLGSETHCDTVVPKHNVLFIQLAFDNDPLLKLLEELPDNPDDNQVN